MPTTRRTFCTQLATAGMAAALPYDKLPAFEKKIVEVSGQKSPPMLASDEMFWGQVMTAFPVDRTLLNLNNGGVSPSPQSVLRAAEEFAHHINKAPHYMLNRELLPRLETIRDALAQKFGCIAEEIAITRNASEALQIVQMGLPLKSGDEIIITTQDYPRMINAWEQRSRREGIVVKKVSYPAPLLRPADFIERITTAVSPKTRVIHLSHVCFITGEILPVREVCAWARERGILTIVDGAHAFAHFPFTYADVGSDFYATSLHKWLYAPLGNGFLFMRREHISNVWALLAPPKEKDNDIRKFEEVGTVQLAIHAAIGEALTFNETLDASLTETVLPFSRKAARLRALNMRWIQRLQQYPSVKFLTSISRPEAWCGLVLVAIEGMDIGKMANYLLQKHRIIVSQMVLPEFRGLRITPNIYTTPAEIDIFAAVMERFARGEIREVKNG